MRFNASKLSCPGDGLVMHSECRQLRGNGDTSKYSKDGLAYKLLVEYSLLPVRLTGREITVPSDEDQKLGVVD